jgi:hypothetical protein
LYGKKKVILYNNKLTQYKTTCIIVLIIIIKIMSIKKILLVPVLSLLGMNSFAEYQIQYPNVPVIFKDLGQWVPTNPVISIWVNVGTPHDCTSAAPLENTQQLGVSYEKTFSGCKQSQERTVTTSEKQTVTGAIRNQVSTKETQVLTDASYKVNAIGTTDFGQWLETAPVYTGWRNLESPHDCTSAAPLENTQTLGSTYVKTFSGCKQSQERDVTTSEKNTVTGNVRNVKTTKETQLITDATYTTNATGTKIVKECGYSAASGAFARWYDIATYDGYTTTYGMGLQWAGATLVNTANSSTTYPKSANYVKSGYVYTRGAFKEKSGHNDNIRTFYYYYEVCREPVTP